VFECKFDVSDGPQSLIVVPEETARVPKKKAEIEMSASRCVANCEMLQSKKLGAIFRGCENYRGQSQPNVPAVSNA